MLYTLDGEAHSPFKGEVPQGGTAILVNLFYKKPPARCPLSLNAQGLN